MCHCVITKLVISRFPKVSDLQKQRVSVMNRLQRKTKHRSQALLRWCVSVSALGSHELAWMNFMHFELSEHDFWPSRDAVYEYFQNYLHQTCPSKHVILDAKEVPYTEANKL